MREKIFTDLELEIIKKVAQKLLEPVNGIIVFDKPRIIHCTKSDHTGYVEWDEPWYKISVNTTKGIYTHRESFFEPKTEKDLVRVAWGIVWSAFNALDGDLNSELAKKLWPPSNGGIPDYESYLQETGK